MTQANESVTKIIDMIKDIETAMLTSQTSDGSLHSRPMATQAHRFDGNVWFFSKASADVVSEVAAHPAVNVAYADNGRYVSIAGDAKIITNIETKKSLWNDSVAYWLDLDDPESPEVVLINVISKSAQYWESPTGVIGKAISAIKVMWTGDVQDASESHQVKLS